MREQVAPDERKAEKEKGGEACAFPKQIVYKKKLGKSLPGTR